MRIVQPCARCPFPVRSEPEKGGPASPRQARRSNAISAPRRTCVWNSAGKNGIEPQLHCQNYDQWTPLWMQDDVPSVKKALDPAIRRTPSDYGDRASPHEASTKRRPRGCGAATGTAPAFPRSRPGGVELRPRSPLPARERADQQRGDGFHLARLQHNRGAY
jgi:hypothetical protein